MHSEPSQAGETDAAEDAFTAEDLYASDPFDEEPGETVPAPVPLTPRPEAHQTTASLSAVPLEPLPALAADAPPIVVWWEALNRRWAEIEWRWPEWRSRRRPRPLPQAPQELADYRDRISVATWMVVLGLGASLMIQLPTIELSFWALGSPVSLPLTGTVLSAIFLAMIAAIGAEGVVSVHPWFAGGRRQRVHTWAFWALPMAITIISEVLLPLAPSPVIQVLALLVSAALLAASYFGLYATVEPGRPGFRRARLLLDALAYGSALLLFLFVYQTRTRSLLSGSLVALTALLLAAEILRTATDRSSTALTYAGIIGLILGQVTWALNYWVLPGLTGGLLLLLIFYLLLGIAQQGLQGRLTQRVLLEFGIFGLVALVLIAVVGPGF